MKTTANKQQTLSTAFIQFTHINATNIYAMYVNYVLKNVQVFCLVQTNRQNTKIIEV